MIHPRFGNVSHVVRDKDRLQANRRDPNKDNFEMASVYKRTTDKNNRRAVWHFSFIDETGKRCQRKGFTDKAATERLAIKKEEDARMVREGLKDATPDQEQKKLNNLVEAYCKHLRQRDVSQFQVQNVRIRIEKTIAACEFEIPENITAQPIEDYLAKRREAGMGKQTSNHYRQAMHQFCLWLRKRSFIKHNPVSEIPKLNVDTDRRHDRRPLSVDEFHRLIIAAENGKPVEAIDGIDRAMMYILSAWTGYRRGEISSLTIASFELDADPPRVTVAATRPKSEWVGKVIAKIGQAANIIVDEADERTGKPIKYASAHDLRRSCGQRLRDAGVPPLLICRVMRHSSWDTTRMHYAPGNNQKDAEAIRNILVTPRNTQQESGSNHSQETNPPE